MALFIEFFPLLVFFVFYKMYDMFWATGALMVALLVQIAYSYFTQGKVEKKHWIFLAITVALGSMTLLLRDERFIMYKPTAIYALLAIGFVGAQLFFDRYPLKAVLGEVIKVENKIWRNAGLLWAAFFAVIAVINIWVAQNFDQETWVNFKVFWVMGATVVLVLVTVAYLISSMSEEDKKALMEDDEQQNKDKGQD